MTLEERIAELVNQHGSLRALARVMGCSPPYICRLRAGVTKNPGPAVLRKLGLRRVVTYERLKRPDAKLTGLQGPQRSRR
jgi:transcriptional regulator with XRE-family HTH domain